MRKRTRAREVALQFLYQIDLRGDDILDTLPSFLETAVDEAGVRVFAQQLVRGVLERRDAIDRRLAAIAQNWDLIRMAVVDRNILRLASYELLWCDDIPPKVAINEAIELGKRFGTEHSGAFINGILDRLREGEEDTGEGRP